MASLYETIARKNETTGAVEPTAEWWPVLHFFRLSEDAAMAGEIMVQAATAHGQSTAGKDDLNQLARSFSEAAEPPLEPEEILDLFKGARHTAIELDFASRAISRVRGENQ